MRLFCWEVGIGSGLSITLIANTPCRSGPFGLQLLLACSLGRLCVVYGGPQQNFWGFPGWPVILSLRVTFALTLTSDLSIFLFRFLLQPSSGTCEEPRTLGTGTVRQGRGQEQSWG